MGHEHPHEHPPTTEPEQVRVAVAGPTDWQAVRQLRLSALADTPDAFGATLEEESARPESWWRGRLEPDAPGTTLLASLVDPEGVPRPAGLVVVAPSFHGPASEAGIYAVGVAPSARGRGVGDALLHSAVNHARQSGYARVVLDVGDFNEVAQVLYARHGFTRTGRTGTLPAPRTHVTEHELALDL
jgi:ribosomal protein S18 acetylase RimI-like enzyme